MNLKNNSNLQLLLLASLSILLLFFNLVIEMSSGSQIDNFLMIRVFVSISITFLIKKNYHKINKIIVYFSIFWILVFIFNITLNMINVYQLDRFTLVSGFCQNKPDLCDLIYKLFFKLKFFRFITLSSYFFSIPLLILAFSIICDYKKTVSFKNRYLSFFFYLILAIIIFSNLIRSIQVIYLSIIQSVQVLEENYYDRFTFKQGGVSYYGWIRVYSNFVISQIGEDENLLLPPQSDLYKMEGNVNYFRWFMYPRRLYHLEDLDKDENIKVDYIVISAGECDTKDCVWPDYQIENEKIDKIILINRETQKIEELIDIDYEPKHFYQKWGLIKLK